MREPHRHDYHELIWVRAGSGQHLIDGEPVPVRPGTVTIIGRGPVHVFEHAEGLTGAVLRFADELLLGDGRVAPGWLLAGRGGRSVPVPARRGRQLEDALRALAAEAARPPDPYSADLLRHLVSAVLLWVERWYDAVRTERRERRRRRRPAAPALRRRARARLPRPPRRRALRRRARGAAGGALARALPP